MVCALFSGYLLVLDQEINETLIIVDFLFFDGDDDLDRLLELLETDDKVLAVLNKVNNLLLILLHLEFSLIL